MKTPGVSSAETTINHPGVMHESQLKHKTSKPHDSPALSQQTLNTPSRNKGKTPQIGGEEEHNDPRNIALSDYFDPFTFILQNFKLDMMEVEAIKKGMATMGKEALIQLLLINSFVGINFH